MQEDSVNRRPSVTPSDQQEPLNSQAEPARGSDVFDEHAAARVPAEGPVQDDFRESQDFRRIGAGRGQRLFTVDVLARHQRSDGHSSMRLRDRKVDNDADIRHCEEFIDRAGARNLELDGASLSAETSISAQAATSKLRKRCPT
jgi:hypothetical protein